MGKWYNQKKVIELNESEKKHIYDIKKNIKYETKWDDYYTMISIYFQNNENILFKHGDVCHSIDLPIITKTRPIDCNSNILLPLNINRHWKDVLKFKYKDIPFQKKKSICFWRGTTTGKLSRPGNRFDLIKKWFNKDEKIDIGFSNIRQS